MINLLEETLEVLKHHDKTIFDIEWFGDNENQWTCDIQGLLNFTYDNGYGIDEIPSGFILVGKDFWLERHEYDGSEWWEFKQIPKKPNTIKTVNNLLEQR